MNRFVNARARLLIGSLAAGWILLSIGQAGAQEKHRYFFKTPEGVAKYTQQHVIDVGDVPGHQVRVFELHTKYAGIAPLYDGVKVAEGWTRGISDYTNGAVTPSSTQSPSWKTGTRSSAGRRFSSVPP